MILLFTVVILDIESIIRRLEIISRHPQRHDMDQYIQASITQPQLMPNQCMDTELSVNLWLIGQVL